MTLKKNMHEEKLNRGEEFKHYFLPLKKYQLKSCDEIVRVSVFFYSGGKKRKKIWKG